ncbi:MAG: hypothetical protein V1720_02870 [bacterium]
MKNKLYYLTPALLAVFMFVSNFLSTDIFSRVLLNFTVWFILSLFSFVCGWIINKTLGWNHGGKIVFAVTVSTTFISVGMVSFFHDYFGQQDLLTENLILYSLRNIVLGAMGLFGMSVAELILLQKTMESQKQKADNSDKSLVTAKKEADYILNDARQKADRIIFEAEKKSNEIFERKAIVENQLRELITAEKELIKKYEMPES